MSRERIQAWVREHPAALITVLLSFATLAVYLQTAWFDFTNYDEYLMVLRNPVVTAGLTFQGLAWALTTSYFEYWHPLTWLSHMLDCELFGLWAGGHHLVNVALHLANTLLLFTFLRRTTGRLGPSAFVAALFALHPAKVESVAWIAERKDVLSGLFFLLALHAYARYVEHRRDAGPDTRRAGVEKARSGRTAPAWRYYYRWTLVAYICGLMVKPMVVTLPFVLLLLDVWPFGRWDLANARLKLPALLREKVPLFILTVLGCVVAYVSVEAGGSIIDTGKVPLSMRLANTPVYYVQHLLLVIWPSGLMPIYPPATGWAWWKTAGALVILGGISAAAVASVRRMPSFLVGWCIFLGMLVPTIGLVSVTLQPVADRYAYLPTIGLFIPLAWGAASLFRSMRLPSAAPIALATVIVAVLGALSWIQTGYWRDSLALWSRCLELHPESVIASYNKGLALQDLGRTREAVEFYQRTVELKPEHLDAHLNLGVARLALGEPAIATNQFTRALRIQVGYPKALSGLGAALFELGDIDGAAAYCQEAIHADPALFGPYAILGRVFSARGDRARAIQHFLQAIRLAPGSAQTHHLVGCEYLATGNLPEAEVHLREAARLAPRWSDPHLRLADVLNSQRRSREAVAAYRQGLRSNPDSPEALNNLSWILATNPDPALRDGAEATRLAWAACQLTGHKLPVLVGTLAAAFAEAGEFDKAEATAHRAAAMARALGDTNLAAINEELAGKFHRKEAHRVP